MRLLIDTTAINLHGRPLTGIPRVVRNYLVLGYGFGRARGVEVLPVAISDGDLVLQRRSANFPHPDGLPRSMSRSRPWPMVLLALHYVALGIAYALFAVPWFGLRLRDRLRGTPARPEALAQRLEGVFEVLERPASRFWQRYMQTVRIEPDPEDILFCPAYWHDVSPQTYARFRGRMKAIYTLVHDVIPVSHPELYRAPWRDQFRENARAALRNFSGVVTISGYTASMLRRLFPDEAAQATITVCHNGLDPLLDGAKGGNRLAALFPADNRPYLMVGTIEPKKGHRMVLAAIESLWAGGQSTRSLVILGRKGWMYDEIVRAIATTPHRDKVVWLRDTTDAELAYAYEHAHALIHASTVEGFGLPLVECAAHGTPVLANRSEIATEVLGDFGAYFDTTPDSLTEALLALEDPDEHARLVARIAGFSWPTWEQVVPALFDALVAAAQGKAPLPPVIDPR
jgi:alpha-1,2-rhamnosyltransferase